MKKSGLLFITVVFLVSAGGCVQTQNSSVQDKKLYGGLPTGTPQYMAAQQVFIQSCVPCHSYQGLTQDEMLDEGLAVQGNLDASPLYYRLSNSAGAGGPKDMPPSGALTAADIDKIKVFIESI